MENDPMCRICFEPAVIGHSIINTKEINGVEVGENYYYCSQACKYLDKRKFFKNLGLILIILGIVITIFSIVSGMFIVTFGMISIGYAIIQYPKKEEMYAAIQSDTLSFSEREELAAVIENAMENSESDDFDTELTFEGGADLYPVAPPRLNPTNPKQVYSDILEKYVDPCCYQTARLLDKYCMCGKAMGYITED